jgi:hypothetical protein
VPLELPLLASHFAQNSHFLLTSLSVSTLLLSLFCTQEEWKLSKAISQMIWLSHLNSSPLVLENSQYPHLNAIWPDCCPHLQLILLSFFSRAHVAPAMLIFLFLKNTAKIILALFALSAPPSPAWKSFLTYWQGCLSLMFKLRCQLLDEAFLDLPP